MTLRFPQVRQPHSARAALFASLCAAAALGAQSATPPPALVAAATRSAVTAVADSALRMITAGNWNALADLMQPDAQTSSARELNGQIAYRTRTVADTRATPAGAAIIERGFDAEVHVSGLVAMVWLPYDIYVGGKWSHCGVDVFTMVWLGGAWKIGNLTYSVEQPPACRMHPSGPPPGLRAP